MSRPARIGYRTGPARDRLRSRLTLTGYSAGWAAVRRLPDPAAYALSRLAADVAWRRRGRGLLRLEANLRRVVGPDVGAERLRALSRAGMRSYLRYWCEFARLPVWSAARTIGAVRVIDEHYMRDALASGRGYVAALAHMGNWDLVGAWGGLTGVRVTTVAERLEPAELFDRFVAARERLGLEILPLTGGGDLLGALADRLRAGGLVALLADRDLKASGIEVTFFGAATRMPPGPALLALRTGAPLHPVTVSYEGSGVRMRMHPEVRPPATGTTRERVTQMTQAVANVFEAAITEHPEDWHMLQPLWLDDLAAPGAAATRPPGTAVGGAGR